MHWTPWKKHTSALGLQWGYVCSHKRSWHTSVHTRGEEKQDKSEAGSSEDLLGAKSFNKSCPQPLLQCSQYRLALDMNYLSLTYATLNQQQEQNTYVEGFFPWISFLVFSFWTLSLRPFWVYLFPYCVPYFPTASVMILSSQEFTLLGLKNN